MRSAVRPPPRSRRFGRRRIFSAEEIERARAFGARLRALREGAGLTADQLAEAVAVSAEFYRRLEAGDAAAMNRATVDLVYELTDAMGLDPFEFFRGLD